MKADAGPGVDDDQIVRARSRLFRKLFYTQRRETCFPLKAYSMGE